jgi:tetratricopeptide (TPR) repeat protein
MNESGEAEAASSTRLFALAKDLLSTFPSTFILVDAIDECNTEERCLILDHLNDLTGPDSTTKVMILSRREPDIKKKMASCPSYAISSTDTSSDITQYVSTCLNQETNFSITIKQPLKLDIGHKLSKAAQGNFLWVRLMIDTLQKQPFEDYEQLKDAVTNLPLGLGSAYGRVLLQLLHQPKLFHNAAILALQLVTTSLRPLTIPQLRHAFSVLNDPNVALFVSQVHLSKFIEDTAGQILTVNSLKQVGFVHHTLSEFLTSPSELWTEDRRLISKFHVDLPKAHEMHAICCVESLLKGTYCLKDFDLQVCDKDHGYFDYAAEHWADHVSGASPATGTLIKHVSDFLESEKGMFWLVYRLQNPTAILTTLSQLMLVEYKLKIWSESSSDSDGIRKLVKNCVQTLYQRWHTRIKMKLPKSDPRLLESSNVLAQIHFVKGQYSESAEIYFSNMSLARQALGDDNPITLRCISGLAVVRTLQGRWAEAIELAREALQGQIALLGSMHQETLGGFELLGEAIVKGVHHIKDRTIEEMQIEGEEVLRTSLQGRRKLLGKEHPDTLKSLHNLARAFMAQNRYAEAEEALLEHRGIVKRVLGSDHRSYIHSMDDLAVVYLETGHPSEAEATHEYLLAQRTRLLGPEHPDTANSIWHLGVLQQDQGRYEQAIANLSLLEPLNTKNYGPSHRYTMKPMARIGEMYVALGQHEKAGPVLKRVVDNCDRTNATSIAMTVQSAKQLEYVYYQLGYKGKAKALKNRSWILEKPTDLALNKRTAAAGSWSSRRLLIALLAVVVLWFLTPSFRILTDPRGIFLFNSSHKSSCPP